MTFSYVSVLKMLVDVYLLNCSCAGKTGSNIQSILAEFVKVLKRSDAAELDLTSLDAALTGAEMNIYVDRQSLLQTANEELTNVDIDIRIPLRVNFYGEGIKY